MSGENACFYISSEFYLYSYGISVSSHPMDLEVVSDSLWYRQKTSGEFYLDSGSGHRCMKTWNRYYTVCQIMAAKWLEGYRPIVAIVVWCESHSGNRSLLPAIKGTLFKSQVRMWVLISHGWLWVHNYAQAVMCSAEPYGNTSTALWPCSMLCTMVYTSRQVR